MSKLDLQDIDASMLEVAKPWYKSKTMWLNILSGAVFFTEGLSSVLSGMAPLLGPALPWVVFVVALLNLFLRSITTKAVV